MCRARVLLFVPVAAAILTACSSAPPTDHYAAAIAAAGLPSSVNQVVVVSSDKPGSASAQLALYARTDRWQRVLGPLPAMVGRNGIAARDAKREGDGKTPSGVYAIGTAFGYGDQAETKMPYRQLATDDVWVDDPAAPDYNTLTKRSATQAKSFELMRRDDGVYAHGLVIEYNTHPVRAGAGSAIFLHVWASPGRATSGCVAADKTSVQAIMAQLDPDRLPFIFIDAGAAAR